jgi:hypothetical protein
MNYSSKADEYNKQVHGIDKGVRDGGRVVPAERVRENWLAIALEMQRDARAGLAIQRKRLREILAGRERIQSATR